MKFCASFNVFCYIENESTGANETEKYLILYWVQYPDAFVVIPAKAGRRLFENPESGCPPQGDMTNTSLLAARIIY
jgi:hypothetical protein